MGNEGIFSSGWGTWPWLYGTDLSSLKRTNSTSPDLVCNVPLSLILLQMQFAMKRERESKTQKRAAGRIMEFVPCEEQEKRFVEVEARCPTMILRCNMWLMSHSHVFTIFHASVLSITESTSWLYNIWAHNHRVAAKPSTHLTGRYIWSLSYLAFIKRLSTQKKKSWIRIVCSINVFWGEVSYRGSTRITLFCCCCIMWFPCRTRVAFQSVISVKHRLTFSTGWTSSENVSIIAAGWSERTAWWLSTFLFILYCPALMPVVVWGISLPPCSSAPQLGPLCVKKYLAIKVPVFNARSRWHK